MSRTVLVSLLVLGFPLVAAADDVAIAPAASVQPARQVRLVGVMLSSAQALLWDDERGEYVLHRVGDDALGGRLVELDSDHIVIERGEAREVLEMTAPPQMRVVGKRAPKRMPAMVITSVPDAAEKSAAAIPSASVTPAANAPAAVQAMSAPPAMAAPSASSVVMTSSEAAPTAGSSVVVMSAPPASAAMPAPQTTPAPQMMVATPPVANAPVAAVAPAAPGAPASAVAPAAAVPTATPASPFVTQAAPPVVPQTPAPVAQSAPAIVQPSSPTTTPAVVAPARPSAPATGAVASAVTPDRKPVTAAMVIPRADFDRALGDFAALSQDIQVTPQPEGGFRLTAVRSGSFFDRIGLRANDVVLRVDGRPMNGVEDASAAYAWLRVTDHFNVEVLRDGRPITLQYVIAPSQPMTASVE